MNNKRRVNIGAYYSHFKGNLYQVTDLVKVDDGTLMVVFRRVCEDGSLSPVEKTESIREFLSYVNKRKYPDAKQKFRYEEETFGFDMGE